MARAALLLPVVAGILWGSVGFFVRILAAEGLDSMAILAARTTMAAAILFAALAIFRRDLLRIRPADLGVFVLSGVVGMLGLNLCYNESIARLTLSFAAVLLSLGPVFVIFLARLFFREAVTPRKMFCLLLACLGCLFVSGALEQAPAGELSVLSIGVGLLSALLYALYSIFCKVALLRGCHAVTILFYSLLTAGTVSALAADWGPVAHMVDASPLHGGLFLVAHALCTGLLPYVFFTVSLMYVAPGTAAILSSCEPAAAMLIGLAVFAESPTLLNVCGMALTVAALVILCLPDRRASR